MQPVLLCRVRSYPRRCPGDERSGVELFHHGPTRPRVSATPRSNPRWGEQTGLSSRLMEARGWNAPVAMHPCPIATRAEKPLNPKNGPWAPERQRSRCIELFPSPSSQPRSSFFFFLTRLTTRTSVFFFRGRQRDGSLPTTLFFCNEINCGPTVYSTHFLLFFACRLPVPGHRESDAQRRPSATFVFLILPWCVCTVARSAPIDTQRG